MKTFAHEFLRTVTFISIILVSLMALAGVDKICVTLINELSMSALLFILGCFSTFFVTRVAFLLRPSIHN